MADRSAPTRFLIRVLLYPLQAALICSAYFLIRALPIETSAAVGSFLFRRIGPRFRADRVARRNIRRVFPAKTDAEVDALVDTVWDNLGRGAGEFAHLDRLIPAGRVEIVGAEHLRAMREDGKPGVVFSGHLGNWELASFVVASQFATLGQIYRGADNPYLDWLFRRARSQGSSTLIPKGRNGAAMALRLMRDGEHLALLMDQKLNEGAAIPFFGVDAMTATAPAALALKFDAPIVPGRCIRLPNSRFRVEFYPPLELPATGDRKADERTVLVHINRILEDWIREYPEQWFWLHRRWPGN